MSYAVTRKEIVDFLLVFECIAFLAVAVFTFIDGILILISTKVLYNLIELMRAFET